MAISRANLQKLDQLLKQAEGLTDSELRFLRAELGKMIGKPATPEGPIADEPTPFGK